MFQLTFPLVLSSFLASQATWYADAFTAPKTLVPIFECGPHVHRDSAVVWTSDAIPTTKLMVATKSSIDIESLLDNKKVTKSSIDIESLVDDEKDSSTDILAGDTNWLRLLKAMPRGIIWTIPIGFAATLTYTGYYQQRLGFRFKSNIGGKVYSFSFTTTTHEDVDANTSARSNTRSSTGKGMSFANSAKYVMETANKNLPSIELSILDYNLGDDVMQVQLVSKEAGISVQGAAGVEFDTPGLKIHMAQPGNSKAQQFLSLSRQAHLDYCTANLVGGSVSEERLTKEINTALEKGSMHVQQVKDFKSPEGQFDERLRLEAANRIQQAGVYLTEFSRLVLSNLVKLKKDGSLTVSGEHILAEGLIDNAYARVALPTFEDYAQRLPIGFVSTTSTQTFKKFIRLTEMKTKLIEAVVDSLGIVNNPVFEKEAVTRLAGTIGNLLNLVRENRKEDTAMKLFTVTPLTEVRNGDTIVTIKITEFTMKASTWSDTFKGCDTKVEDRGAKLEYTTRAMSVEVVNELLETASEAILGKLTNAIKAYDNSDIPDEIDINAL